VARILGRTSEGRLRTEDRVTRSRAPVTLPPGVRYIGEWRNDGTWRDFLLGRAIFELDPVYGHRLRRNSAIQYRYGGRCDLFVVDADGFVPNTLQSPPTRERIRSARESGASVAVLMGGSTVFGHGAATPEENIASSLERALAGASTGPSIVVNGGVGGYASDSQLRYLLHEIIPMQPDRVIFYDGWNDCAYLNGLLTTHGDRYTRGRTTQSYSLAVREESLLYFRPTLRYTLRLGLRLLTESVRAVPLLGTPSLAVLRLLFPGLYGHPGLPDFGDTRYQPLSNEIYAHNIRSAAALCAAFGIEFHHFLQPLLSTGHKTMTEAEQRVMESYGYAAVDRNFYDAFEGRTLTDASFRGAVSSVSLRDVFKSTAEEVYLDVGHLNGRGNQIVADAMAGHLRG
jgi:hypothetical protein